jgi:hypothetical protein
MRNGLTFSAIAHVVALLMAIVLVGSPTPFAPAPVESVAVDIVTPEEIKPPQEAQPPEEQRPAEESLLPTQRPPEFGPESEAKAKEPQASETPQTSPAPQEPKPQAVPTPQQQQQPQPQQQQTPEQQAQPQSPQPQQQANTTPPDQSIFAPSRVQQLLDMMPSTNEQTPATGPGVDAPAESRANLTGEEVAQLKAHLRKCWKTPPGMESSQRMRVVVRLFLAPDGALAADPELVEAPPPTRSGPRLVEAAMNAVKQCQPFGFLPSDRYNEWKILDVNISPREMGG